MKFSLAAIAAITATTALSAPQPKDDSTTQVKTWAKAKGEIDCNIGTRRCTVACGEGLQQVCNIVGMVDSLLYGLETIIGFTINCDETGCNVYCPVDGTVTCALNEAGAAINSVVVVGETIILNGLQDLLSGASPLED